MSDQDHHAPEAGTAADNSAEPERGAATQEKISPRMQYATFLGIIKAGRTPLEAARELNITATVMRRFIADAIMQKEFERPDFTYETVWAKDLPRPLALMLKASASDLVKAELLQDGSLTINILK